MKVEIHRTKGGVLWWRDGCLWQLTISAGHEIDVDEMLQFAEAARQYRGGAKAPLLVDRTHSYSPSFAALQYIAANAPQFFSAVAYYAPTGPAASASAVVRDTFLRGMPVAIFADRNDALRWLKKFVIE